MRQKEKFPLYLLPEKKAELERRYHEDGSRSLTEFICHAIEFYLGYLSTDKSGAFLPPVISAAIDGRLSIFENRISSLLYKLAVENDMTMSMMAEAFNASEVYVREQRARSVQNVKKTNGQLRFEQIARRRVEDEDDEWQD